MTDEPMSDERLAEIRARAEAIRNWLLTPESDGKGHFPTSRRILGVDSLALLAEVERLRAREAALRSQLQRFLYPFEPPFTCDPCPWCHCSQDYEPHAPDCPVTKARALLAQE